MFWLPISSGQTWVLKKKNWLPVINIEFLDTNRVLKDSEHLIYILMKIGNV